MGPAPVIGDGKNNIGLLMLFFLAAACKQTGNDQQAERQKLFSGKFK
jgi:hypothetical protein